MPVYNNSMYRDNHPDQCNLSTLQCELQYEATGIVGLYAVALQVEDFASPIDTEPLSSVPVQFLVRVTEIDGIGCDTKPELVGETPVDGSCIGVALGETYESRIVAKAIPGSRLVSKPNHFSHVSS